MRVRPLAKPIFVGFASLALAPAVGLWAAMSLPNPPGTGPGIGQVFAGVTVPLVISGTASLITRTRLARAGFWATGSLVMTGLFLVVLFVLVALALQPS